MEARGGSEHIEFLVNNNFFILQPSSVLDTAYAVSSMGLSVTKLEKEFKALKTAQEGSQSTSIQPQESAEHMLLSQGDSIFIADCLNIPELAPEVERAVWQVERSIEARAQLRDENEKLEAKKEKIKGLQSSASSEMADEQSSRSVP